MAADLYYRVLVTADEVSYDLSEDLTSFFIEEEEGKADELVVRMSDPFKVFGHAFQEGMDVEVDLGTVEDHSIVFRGRIHNVDGDFPREGVPSLTVRAHDHSMRMGLRCRNRVWKDVKLSEIVRSIGHDHTFDRTEVNVLGDPEFTGNGIRQQDETDLAFLLRLARENGCETYVAADDAGETLNFIAESVIMSSDPAVTLYYGRCGVPNRLLSFQPRSDVSDIQLPRVFSGIDYDSGKPVDVHVAEPEDVGTLDDAFFDENLSAFREREPARADRLEEVITAAPTVRERLEAELGAARRQTTPAFASPELLSERAKNQFSTRLYGMSATGATPGNQHMHAQMNVMIGDVGGRFSGTWYLSRVRHVLDDQGYRTEFECQR